MSRRFPGLRYVGPWRLTFDSYWPDGVWERHYLWDDEKGVHVLPIGWWVPPPPTG